MEDTKLKDALFTVLKNGEPIKSEELLEAFVAIGSRLFDVVHVESKEDGGVKYVVFTDEDSTMEELLGGAYREDDADYDEDDPEEGEEGEEDEEDDE